MDIIRGNHIRIRVGRIVVTGMVLSAINWRNYRTGADDWYIELERDTASDYGPGYGYWKQSQDGGTVEVLS